MAIKICNCCYGNVEPAACGPAEVVVDPQAIRDRIVSTLHPRRIVVFGKGTRDEAGADSDLDFLRNGNRS